MAEPDKNYEFTEPYKHLGHLEPYDFRGEYVVGKQAVCPHCSKVIDAAAGGLENGPKEGSITICAYCAEAAAFNKDMTLRHLTDAETKDPEIARQLGPLKEVVKSMIRQRGTKEIMKKAGFPNAQVTEFPDTLHKLWRA